MLPILPFLRRRQAGEKIGTQWHYGIVRLLELGWAE